MKYSKIYDSRYTNVIIGYKTEKEEYIIYKDAHLSYSGNEIIEGWYVLCDGKRVFWAGTLKEAKAFVESI